MEGQLVSSPGSGESDGHAQVKLGGVYGQKDTDDRQRPQLLGRSHQEQGRELRMGALGTTGIPSVPI